MTNEVDQSPFQHQETTVLKTALEDLLAMITNADSAGGLMGIIARNAIAAYSDYIEAFFVQLDTDDERREHLVNRFVEIVENMGFEVLRPESEQPVEPEELEGAEGDTASTNRYEVNGQGDDSGPSGDGENNPDEVSSISPSG